MTQGGKKHLQGANLLDLLFRSLASQVFCRNNTFVLLHDTFINIFSTSINSKSKAIRKDLHRAKILYSTLEKAALSLGGSQPYREVKVSS